MRKTSNHGSRITDHGSQRERGVTLIEMIMVIVITGIIGVAVAIFLRGPIEGYMDAARRAELSDVADTALRRFTRDLRTALPNSIRINGAYLEYLQTSGGGRYRAEVDGSGNGNILDFTNFAVPDTSFDVFGVVPTLTGVESIVVYNLNSDSSVTTSNAYYGDNRGRNASAAGSTITFTPPESPPATAIPFPFASPGKRFHVVQYPVSYHCDLGTGQLRRYWGYTIQVAQPTGTLPLDGSSTLLATHVTDCSFTYATDGATGRTGVVALTLQIEQSGEKVRLFQQVHVNNVP
jgi:MSHA biogenesis protein MshO